MNDKDVKFVVITPIPIMMERLERHVHILMHREDYSAYRYLSKAVDYTVSITGITKVQITIELNHEE